jgi:hypothetical protein
LEVVEHLVHQIAPELVLVVVFQLFQQLHLLVVAEVEVILMFRTELQAQMADLVVEVVLQVNQVVL